MIHVLISKALSSSVEVAVPEASTCFTTRRKRSKYGPLLSVDNDDWSCHRAWRDSAAWRFINGRGDEQIIIYISQTVVFVIGSSLVRTSRITLSKYGIGSCLYQTFSRSWLHNSRWMNSPSSSSRRYWHHNPPNSNLPASAHFAELHCKRQNAIIAHVNIEKSFHCCSATYSIGWAIKIVVRITETRSHHNHGNSSCRHHTFGSLFSSFQIVLY